MLRNLLVTLLTALLTVVLTVAAQSPARGLRDQQIEAEIRERLAKSVIGKENFKVRVKEGIAYWEGSTLVPQRKGAATRMAKSAGARSVINNILVRPAPPKNAGKAAVQKSPPNSPAPSAASPDLPPATRRVTVQWGPRP